MRYGFLYSPARTSSAVGLREGFLDASNFVRAASRTPQRLRRPRPPVAERRTDQRIADDIGSRARSCADLRPVVRGLQLPHQGLGKAQRLVAGTHQFPRVGGASGVDDQHQIVDLCEPGLELVGNRELEQHARFLRPEASLRDRILDQALDELGLPLMRCGFGARAIREREEPDLAMDLGGLGGFVDRQFRERRQQFRVGIVRFEHRTLEPVGERLGQTCRRRPCGGRHHADLPTAPRVTVCRRRQAPAPLATALKQRCRLDVRTELLADQRSEPLDRMRRLDRRVGVQLDDLDLLDGRGLPRFPVLPASSRLACAIARRMAPTESPMAMLVVELPPISSTDRPTFGMACPSSGDGCRVPSRSCEHVLERGAAKKVAELPGAEIAPLAESDDDRTRRQAQRLLHRGALAQNHRRRSRTRRDRGPAHSAATARRASARPRGPPRR